MRTITLQPQDAWSHRDDNAEGLTVVETPHTYEFEGETHEGTYRETLLPELGPKSAPKNTDGPVVVEIKGRRFQVVFGSTHDDYDFDYDFGEPVAVPVTFIETDEPLTEMEVWDYEAKHREFRADTLVAIERSKKWAAEDTSPGTQKFYVEDIKNDERRLAEIDKALETGRRVYQPTNSTYFGQPTWIQNDAPAAHDGKAAYHLATFENGWGDSGNENYLVALDDDGYPVALYHEASCC